MAMTGKTPRKTLPPGITKVLKRLHYPLDVILLCVRWYVTYSLSCSRQPFANTNVRLARAGGWMKVCHEHKRKLVVLY
ncbi:hypothetical protein OKW43_007931 [Paraburkholderia sp. WC7.3g]